MQNNTQIAPLDAPICSASWIDIREHKPSEDEEVLTLMKHGCISGYYDTKEDEFQGYYWHDMRWSARYWMPLPAPPNALAQTRRAGD